MKLSISFAFLATLGNSMAQNTMVKMCLFYDNPSGHARSDPIINQQCASGHVHTFYGPQNFHPNTSYENIRDTPARFSSTPFIENESLYWHPSIYEVTNNGDGTKTYTRVDNLEFSPYYRWDNSVSPTKAFPPRFRMIAHSNDPGASNGGEKGFNMFTECCDVADNEEETCEFWDMLHFPTRTCGFLGIALAMPTCWDGYSLGDDNDHKSHMAYTIDGEVNGPCPDNFGIRLPQVQVFIRIPNYKGGTYQLSDGSDVFHVDFFNGWKESKLQEIIDNCPVADGADYGYNPPCGCTGDDGEPNFLTPNTEVAGPVCDVDVRELIMDEATDVVSTLPIGSCTGDLITKSWNQITDDLFDCSETPSATAGPQPTPIPTPSPTPIATCATGNGWTDDSGATCSWYEFNEPTGCPQWKWYPGSNGLTAGQACCHCQGNNNGGSCATGNGWTDNSGATCLWYEFNEPTGCPQWKWYPGSNGLTAGQACCHCQCNNVESWIDDSGATCEWYETYESVGCPAWHWYPGQGMTARDACCHCRE